MKKDFTREFDIEGNIYVNLFTDKKSRLICSECAFIWAVPTPHQNLVSWSRFRDTLQFFKDDEHFSIMCEGALLSVTHVQSSADVTVLPDCHDVEDERISTEHSGTFRFHVFVELPDFSRVSSARSPRNLSHLGQSVRISVVLSWLSHDFSDRTVVTHLRFSCVFLRCSGSPEFDCFDLCGKIDFMGPRLDSRVK